MKLTAEMIAELEAKARNSRDNARAELLVAEAFDEEYMNGITGQDKAAGARSLELYDFVIGGRHRARDYERNAELFEAAAAAARAALQEVHE